MSSPKTVDCNHATTSQGSSGGRRPGSSEDEAVLVGSSEDEAVLVGGWLSAAVAPSTEDEAALAGG
eukprot:11185106-Lingulodinium_polyedra.AAC.1